MIRAKSATYRRFSAKYVLENPKKAIYSQFYKILVDLKVSLAKKEACVCVWVCGYARMQACLSLLGEGAYWEGDRPGEKMTEILDLRMAEGCWWQILGNSEEGFRREDELTLILSSIPTHTLRLSPWWDKFSPLSANISGTSLITLSSWKFVIGSYKTSTSMYLTDLLRLPVAKQSNMAGPFPCLSLLGIALPLPCHLHHSILAYSQPLIFSRSCLSLKEH